MAEINGGGRSNGPSQNQITENLLAQLNANAHKNLKKGQQNNSSTQTSTESQQTTSQHPPLDVRGSLLITNGHALDLTTPQGLQQAAVLLSPEQFQALEQAMQAQGFAFDPNLRAFVPDDSYRTQTTNVFTAAASVDPKSGRTDADDFLAGVFADLGIPDPYNANTTPAFTERVLQTKAGRSLQELLNPLLLSASPSPLTPEQLKTFSDRMQDLMAQFPDGNAFELLYTVLREAAVSVNEDRKWPLKRIQDLQKIADYLSGPHGLRYLTNKTLELQQKQAAAGADDKDKQTVSASLTLPDTHSLTSSGDIALWPDSSMSTPRELTTNGLSALTKDLENKIEAVRNQRQEYQTLFQSQEQRQQQVYNILSQLVRSVNEMRSAVIRNIGN